MQSEAQKEAEERREQKELHQARENHAETVLERQKRERKEKNCAERQKAKTQSDRNHAKNSQMDHVINTNFEIVRKDIEEKQRAYDEKQRKF